MNFLDKILYKLVKKQHESMNPPPVEDVEVTANGLEKKIKEQLDKDSLNDKTRTQLEKVLVELESYRKEIK